MSSELENTIHSRYSNALLNHSHDLAALQQRFLAIRNTDLQRISQDLSKVINAVEPSTQTDHPAFLYSREWLVNFAQGDIVQSLGQRYAVYQNRRCPRIPNGDFLLISRISHIQGTQNDFSEPSRIAAELDIPANAWFMEDSDPECPLSILMEMALQPCGVLSAWLGTSLRFPEENYFFRNLDGTLESNTTVDLRGKTVLTQAKLTKTTFNGKIILQHFDFDIFCEGDMLLKGASSFGYFTAEMMAAQMGLEGGVPSSPWGREAANKAGTLQALPEPSRLYPDQPTGKLRLIDKAWISRSGGQHNRGYSMASRRNTPTDWFYVQHFFQDPVMPGSLGLEGVLQAFKALISSLTESEKPITRVPGRAIQWKYRGQVLPSHEKMWVEVHLKDRQATPSGPVFIGDGGLWADDIRIYEIKNLALLQTEGNCQ
jgi:3-hydroxymyristoyl/3-hydroxydecanoyl-(acyl carrier protein) dehydratase